MKIVIDIPNDVKKAFDGATKDDLYGRYYDANSLIGNAIKNGIPLDALIEKILSGKSTKQYDDYHTQNEWDNWNCALEEAVRIMRDFVEADKEGAEDGAD